MAEIGKALLLVQGNGIIDRVANLLPLQMAKQFFAALGANDLLVPGMMIGHAGVFPRLRRQFEQTGQV